MFKRVYSLETEYALAYDGPLAKPTATLRSKEELYELLESEILKCRLHAICDSDRLQTRRQVDPLAQIRDGYFLANGARLYFDTGHLEWAAPETSDPRQALVRDRAGELELVAAAVTVKDHLTEIRPLIVKNNIDYQSGVTYGCHENYSVRRSSDAGRDVIQQLKHCLVPFLVTRQILCGAGRLGADHPPYVAFQLSQRADFTTAIFSDSTRENRPIISIRDDPFANVRDYARLHLMLGDSNMAEYPAFLKLGMTGILLDMMESDVELPDLALADPPDALHMISRDLNFDCRLPLKNGGYETALDIQRAYLAAAWNFATNHNNGDPLTQQVLRWWDGLLTAIEHHNPEVGFCLDWAIKHRIIGRILEQAGITWEELEAWEPVLAQTWKLRLPKSQPFENWSGWLQRYLTKPIWLEIEAHCRKNSLDLGNYPRFRSISAKLRDLDIRYHDIDPQYSLFHKLGGAVRIINDVNEFDAARRDPPSDTRAAIRGYATRLAHDQSQKLCMDWDSIRLVNSAHSISLPDPLSCDLSVVDLLFAASKPSDDPSRDPEARETFKGTTMSIRRFRNHLLEVMADGLDETELNELLYRLDISKDEFVGNKKQRIMDLTQYFWRHHKGFDELLSELFEMAPYIKTRLVELGCADLLLQQGDYE